MGLVNVSRGMTALACMVALAGCDAAAFNSLNETVKSARGASAAIGNTSAPAAALAATLGALEVVKVLTNDFSAASGSGKAPALAAYTLLQVNRASRDVSINQNGVAIDLRYVSEIDAGSGRITGTLERFEGKTQGYTMSAQGTVTFKPAAQRFALRQTQEAQPGEFGLDLSGKLSFKDLNLDLKKLSLGASFPLSPNKELGKLDFVGKDGTNSAAIMASVKTNEKGRLIAGGTLTLNNKSQKISFDQDSPGFTEVQDSGTP